MQSRISRHRLSRLVSAAVGLILVIGSGPVSADHTTPPILPLQGPLVAGQLAIPVFALGLNVGEYGTYRLTGPLDAGGVVLGVFGMPKPFMIVTAASGNHRYTRGGATLVYEFTIVPPPELHCAFPVFAIPGPECRVDVEILGSGRVQTHGSVILAGDPPPSFVVEAGLSIRDDLGVEVFSDGMLIPLTNISDINAVFGEPEVLSLEANRAYRVTMNVDAQAAATTLPAAATALVDPYLSIAQGMAPGFSLRLSNGIGDTPQIPVPQPDSSCPRIPLRTSAPRHRWGISTPMATSTS